MHLKAIFTVFVTIFLAEIGDKTQLATMLFATDANMTKWEVFLGASVALVLAAGVGVIAGDWLGAHVSEKTMRLVAGSGFIVIGVWTLTATG